MASKRGGPAHTTEHFGTEEQRDEADQTGARWYLAQSQHVHEKVFNVVRRIEDAQSWRQTARLKHERLYGNREIAGLTPSKYARAGTMRSQDRLKLNVCKSCVDTASAKIAKNKPRPLFLTSGGDAALQDKAKKLTKFCDGMFDAAGVYAAGQRAFVDSLVQDTGVVKVSDDGGDSLTVERVFVDELYIDEIEAVYGRPQQLHQKRLVHLDVLVALFADDPVKVTAIRAARERAEGTSDHVEVIESWHLRSSPDAKDGVRAMSVKGCTLVLEAYDRDYFPFVFLYWTEPRRGIYGQGLIEELVGIQLEINRLLQTIQEAQHLACVPRVYFDSATAATLKPIDNEMGGHYSFVGRPPVISTANAMPSEIYQHLENLFRKAFEVTGISQLSATAKKPSGLDSGAALREYQDIETERFILVGQRYEAFYMQIARIMLDLMRARAAAEDAGDDKALRVKARSNKFIETIKWSDVEMDEDRYDMQVFPVSLLPTSPAGRLQTVKELVKDGFISDRAQAMGLLDFPDLEAFQSLQTAALDNIRHHIDNILEHGKFEAPDRYIDIKLARSMAQSAYERGEATGRPRERLDDLDTWMMMLDELEDGMAAPAPGGAGVAGTPVPMGKGLAPPMVEQAPPPDFTQ